MYSQGFASLLFMDILRYNHIDKRNNDGMTSTDAAILVWSCLKKLLSNRWDAKLASNRFCQTAVIPLETLPACHFGAAILPGSSRMWQYVASQSEESWLAVCPRKFGISTYNSEVVSWCHFWLKKSIRHLPIYHKETTKLESGLVIDRQRQTQSIVVGSRVLRGFFGTPVVARKHMFFTQRIARWWVVVHSFPHRNSDKHQQPPWINSNQPF